jgi:hypothetical protein
MNPKFVSMGRVSIYTQGDTSLTYTKDDFFIVTRTSVLQYATKFPEGIIPWTTIEWAGYVQACVFGGDMRDRGAFSF